MRYIIVPLKNFIACFLFCTFSTLSCAAELSGLWEEYDDDTGKPEAWIRIEQARDGSYEGHIEKLLPAPH